MARMFIQILSKLKFLTSVLFDINKNNYLQIVCHKYFILYFITYTYEYIMNIMRSG